MAGGFGTPCYSSIPFPKSLGTKSGPMLAWWGPSVSNLLTSRNKYFACPSDPARKLVHLGKRNEAQEFLIFESPPSGYQNRPQPSRTPLYRETFARAARTTILESTKHMIVKQNLLGLPHDAGPELR